MFYFHKEKLVFEVKYRFLTKWKNIYLYKMLCARVAIEF